MIASNTFPPRSSGSHQSAAPAGLPPSRSGRGDYSDDAADRHCSISAQPDDKLLNDLPDQPRAVIIGLKLAAHPGFGTIDIPMIFVPFHSDSEVARG